MLALEAFLLGMLGDLGGGLEVGIMVAIVGLPIFAAGVLTIGAATWAVLHVNGWTATPTVLLAGALTAVASAALLPLFFAPTGIQIRDLVTASAAAGLVAAPGAIAAWIVRSVAYERVPLAVCPDMQP